ncbi:unnamed protein product [marine sediment metagenome]|uniref:Uncharacterized protein n=1 Tax=marine sediment metagenome TaxID=412755 RepID=X1P699_9ZZZZ
MIADVKEPRKPVTGLPSCSLQIIEQFADSKKASQVTPVRFSNKVSSGRVEKGAQAFNPRGLRFMKVNYQATYLYDITLSYIAAFGVVPTGLSYFHYSIQFFSTIAPVFTGVFTGKRILSVY